MCASTGLVLLVTNQVVGKSASKIDFEILCLTRGGLCSPYLCSDSNRSCSDMQHLRCSAFKECGSIP